MGLLKKYFIVIFLFLSSYSLFAQSIEITPLVGYGTRSDISFVEGALEIQDKVNIGVNASFPTYYNQGRFELLISNSVSRGRWIPSTDYSDFITQKNYSMNVTYFQVSWVWEFALQDDLYIFGGPSLGAMNYSISGEDIENILRFSAGAQTGLKYFFENGLGFRLQCHMVLPVFMGNSTQLRGIADYTGEMSDVTVSETTFPANFLFNAGVIFRIKTR